ncbi:MAG: HIT domain-containing protein [Caldilineales bacterium]|nr:HIT domain-containing protein [Caldilineales bacterium]
MERLYTPWRREYVVNPKAVDCPFCEYLSQDASHDADNLILLRSERTFIILNRYPYNNGHLMVLPNLHVSDLEAMDDATQLELMQMTTLAKHLLQRTLQPHGFNVGLNLGKAAGAGLADHLHVHIVPRWSGDTNFMPIVANTRILPEWLGETYQRLRATLASILAPA